MVSTQRQITNTLNDAIVTFCLKIGLFAWRENVLPVPIIKDGKVVGFRSGGISGKPDVFVVMPPQGRLLGVETKTGRDRIRDTQKAFQKNLQHVGSEMIFVKDMADFMAQLNKLGYGKKKNSKSAGA